MEIVAPLEPRFEGRLAKIWIGEEQGIMGAF